MSLLRKRAAIIVAIVVLLGAGCARERQRADPAAVASTGVPATGSTVPAPASPPPTTPDGHATDTKPPATDTKPPAATGCGTTPEFPFRQASATATITEPASGSAVGMITALSIKTPEATSGHVWVLVQVVGPANHPAYLRDQCAATTHFWPIGRPMAYHAAFQGYHGYAACGSQGDTGLRCRVTVVIAAGSADTDFTRYTMDNSGSGPGLSVSSGYRTSVVQLASVVVTRTAG